MRESTCVTTVVKSIDLASESFSSNRDVFCRREALIECVSQRDLEGFARAREALPEYLRGFLTWYSVDDYLALGARGYLTEDGLGGFALINGELATLFSLPGAHYGDMLVHQAVERGAHKLSCFDAHGKLLNLYGRHGFKETARAPWDDSLAPLQWSYERWGRPDYVEMNR